jgi:hypothetical protein
MMSCAGRGGDEATIAGRGRLGNLLLRPPQRTIERVSRYVKHVGKEMNVICPLAPRAVGVPASPGVTARPLVLRQLGTMKETREEVSQDLILAIAFSVIAIVASIKCSKVIALEGTEVSCAEPVSSEREPVP